MQMFESGPVVRAFRIGQPSVMGRKMRLGAVIFKTLIKISDEELCLRLIYVMPGMSSKVAHREKDKRKL